MYQREKNATENRLEQFKVQAREGYITNENIREKMQANKERYEEILKNGERGGSRR